MSMNKPPAGEQGSPQSLTSSERLNAVKDFFIVFYETHPDLFIEESNKFFNGIIDMLEQTEENSDFFNYVEVQRLIFKNIEMNNQEDWYKKFFAVHMNSIRRSTFAKKCFNEVLHTLQKDSETSSFNRVLAPGCGKLFEADQIIESLSSELLLAIDIDYESLEFSRAITCHDKKAKYLHKDLKKSIKHYKDSFDLVLFLHPQVYDFDKFEDSDLFKQYESEDLIPKSKIKKHFSTKYLAKDWGKILSNSIDCLKPKGYLYFVFYEYRELELTINWVKQTQGLNIVSCFKNNHLIDPAFCAPYSARMQDGNIETIQSICMGYYRAGLLVKKSKIFKK